MKEKCIIADRCIIDKFDLPLYEDTIDDFYTPDELKQEVEVRITKLASLSTAYTVSPDSIIKYEITGSSEQIACVESVDTYKYIFRMSRLVARKRNEKYLDSIIYHELCHILQVDFLFNLKVLYFENGELSYNKDQKDFVDLLYYADNHHTKLWYTFVKVANTALVINPPVDKFLSDKDVSDIFLESTFNKEEHVRANAVIMDDFSYLLKDTGLEIASDD